MRTWRVALLVNLALAIGLAVGYGAWGRRMSSLEDQVKAAQARIEQLAREREACYAGGRVGEQLWEGRGVVRAVYPRLLIVTHEDIPGLLPARTTGFRLADTVDRGRTRAGDSVRFWLQGTGQDNPTLVRIEAWGRCGMIGVGALCGGLCHKSHYTVKVRSLGAAPRSRPPGRRARRRQPAAPRAGGGRCASGWGAAPVRPVTSRGPRLPPPRPVPRTGSSATSPPRRSRTGPRAGGAPRPGR